MKKFVKWWWDSKGKKDRLDIMSGILIVLLAIMFIGGVTIFVVSWKLLCFGSLAIYTVGIMLGGFSCVLIGFDKWVQYKYETDDEQTEDDFF